MAKLGKVEQNPLKQPKIVSKWYSIDSFEVTVEKCRACGNPVKLTAVDLEKGRYVKCPCGKGCFEVEVRLVHTIES